MNTHELLKHEIFSSLGYKYFLYDHQKQVYSFKSTPKSFLLLLVLMTSLFILTEKGSSVLKMR